MKLNIQRFAASKSTTFTESNLSTETNTSSLKITIKFSANNSVTYFSSKTLHCTCNGVSKSTSVSLSKGGSVTKSFTFDNIAHNADGTKSVSWSWNCNTGTSALGNISDSGTRTLTKINRQSQFDKTDWDQDTPIDLDTSVEFTINQHLENVYHKITAYILDSNEELQPVATRNNISITNDKYTFSFTSSELTTNVYPLITTSRTKYIRMYLSTYTDSELTQQIGDDDVIWYTGQVPLTVQPSLSIGTLTEADTTMQSLNWGVFVQNKSKLNIPITATGIYGSTIQLIDTSLNGIAYSGTPVITSTLTTSGLNTVTTNIYDSRNIFNTVFERFNVVAYSNPTIEIAQAQRCLSDGTLSKNGTYILYDFKGSISPVSNNNSAKFRIGYKKTTDANYTYVDISTNYTINAVDQVSTFTISSDYAYDIVFEAVDSFTTSSIDRDIDTGFDLLNFNASGLAMAIGTISSAGANEELLEVDLPTEFLQDIETQDIDAVDITAQDITSSNLTATDITASGSISGGSGDFDSLTINSQPIIVIQDYLETISSIASGSTTTVTYDITKSGYTPIAISGISCGNSAINFYVTRITSNTSAQVSVRNIGSATASNIGIRIYVAYIKE